MLVLTRREGESIVIGEIEITVLKTSGNKARLGIVAPKSVKVVRRELFDRTSEEGSLEEQEPSIASRHKS